MARYGYLKHYLGCKIIETSDCYVAVNPNGSTIGQSKTLFGVEGIIEEWVKNNPSK